MNKDYIAKYNKNNYKQYIIRIRKDDTKTINKLDKIKNKNSYFYNLINNQTNNTSNVLSIKQIKQIIKPIFNKYDIKDINLFGSYARGEANNNSDIDIYCERGKAITFLDQAELIDKLQNALNKKVDIIFNTATLQDGFMQNIKEDLIKLC